MTVLPAPSGTLDAVVARLALAPHPRGDGRTLHNWRELARAGADDLVVARLAEAHLDAVTILAELDGPAPPPGSRWGVWAAESSSAVLHAEPEPDGRWRLDGAKPWCSGTASSTHALVTARTPQGGRLFAVAVDDVVARPSTWVATGMAGDAPATVDLHHVPARAVGDAGEYLARPGFWHGAIAVAAVWFGGAVGVARTLRRAGLAGRLDAHGLAHLGAVDAAVDAGRAVLRAAAAEIEECGAGTAPEARRRALRVRATVEDVVETVVRRTGRATGPGPLAHDADHARRVADLEVYVRQSHAERDLADLGALVLDERDAEVL